MSDGRSVAATRPDDGGPTRYVGLLRLLAGRLADIDVGLEAISSWLRVVAAEVGLRDVVLVVEGSSIGRQVFTASGGVLDGGRVERLVRHASAGLYTDPAVRLDEEEVATAVRLCRMAFELDVNRTQSMRDALTGLHNRRGYEIELARCADNAARYGWPFTLALLDIDRFKQINDRWGHAVGDEVLERIGHAIAQQLRSGDVAARTGGDEFALILQGAEPGAVDTLIGRLDERLAEADLPCPVGLSWGWAACPSQTSDPAELYRQLMSVCTGTSGRSPVHGEMCDLEFALREMPDVSYVGSDGSGARPPSLVQVLVTDPERADAVRSRAQRLVARHLGDEVTVDVQVSGVPRRPLLLEARLREPPDVAEVVAVRGPRGELVRVSVTPTDQTAPDVVRQQLLAAGIPAGRLEI